MAVSITWERYYDRVHAIWTGKSLGGTVGAPWEAHKTSGDLAIDKAWPATQAPNDDLDIQIVWLEMLQERGPWFRQSDLVELWQDRCWYNFSEYGTFLHNVQRGIHPPYSGAYNNRVHQECMGCPIRAEIWGMVTPGNPELAAHFAGMDGTLDHIGNSVWAEKFWAAAISQALVCDSREKVFDAALSQIPSDCELAKIYHLVFHLFDRKLEWQRCWWELIRRYGHYDCTKVEVNFGLTLLSYLFGAGDLKQTIVTAINQGWDVDCTAATAGALIGALGGSAAMPADWVEKQGPGPHLDVNTKHKTATFDELARDTCLVGWEIAQTRNRSLTITDLPAELLTGPDNHPVAVRNDQPTPYLQVDYPDQPTLWSDHTTTVNLTLHNPSSEQRQGKLRLSPQANLVVTPAEVDLLLPSGQSYLLPVVVSLPDQAEALPDKNLIDAFWQDQQDQIKTTFGLAGARRWRCYGPYWDIFDTERYDFCLYRNDQGICHPCAVEGGAFAAVHQFVRIDKSYLDETTLVRQDLPDEFQVLVETGADQITSDQIGGFCGEGVFYLVRELTATEEIDCTAVLGSTCPCVVWVDGVEAIRNKNPKPFHWDMPFPIHLSQQTTRIVIKCIGTTAEFEVGLQFLRPNFVGDKTRGVSYLMDSLSEVINKT